MILDRPPTTTACDSCSARGWHHEVQADDGRTICRLCPKCMNLLRTAVVSAPRVHLLLERVTHGGTLKVTGCGRKVWRGLSADVDRSKVTCGGCKRANVMEVV